MTKTVKEIEALKEEKVVGIRVRSKEVTRFGVVHLGTVIVTQWGSRDEDGNVVKLDPVKSECTKLSDDEFSQHQTLALNRKKELRVERVGQKIIHLGTEFLTTFGVEDEDGNVVREAQLQGRIIKFRNEAFADLLAVCKDRRLLLIEQAKELRA